MELLLRVLVLASLILNLLPNSLATKENRPVLTLNSTTVIEGFARNYFEPALEAGLKGLSNIPGLRLPGLTVGEDSASTSSSSSRAEAETNFTASLSADVSDHVLQTAGQPGVHKESTAHGAQPSVIERGAALQQNPEIHRERGSKNSTIAANRTAASESKETRGVEKARPSGHASSAHQKKQPAAVKKLPVVQYESPKFWASTYLALHDAKGKIERLQISVDQPFGDQNRSNPLCSSFWEAKNIAVVGNGPLDDLQRSKIESADVVVRFNMLNNLRRGLERTDVWIARYAKTANRKYWGFAYMGSEDAQRVLDHAKAVILLGGRQADADGLLKFWPSLEKGPGKAILVPEEPAFLALAKKLELKTTVPSSGFVAVEMIRHCAPNAIIDIYGMNWSPSNWEGHSMGAEKKAIQEMAVAGRLKIHPTPCEGMRECGRQADLDNSCHWSKYHRYICLIGERWLDFTFVVPAERRAKHDADFLAQMRCKAAKVKLGLRGAEIDKADCPTAP